MLQEIAKAILNEIALIEEAESDGDDRWNTLKGYLEAATQSGLTQRTADEVVYDEKYHEKYHEIALRVYKQYKYCGYCGRQLRR